MNEKSKYLRGRFNCTAVLKNSKNDSLNEFIIKGKHGDEHIPHIMLGEPHCIIEKKISY